MPPISCEQGTEAREFGYALFRTMRALMMDNKPTPELEALPMSQLRLLMSAYYQRSDGTMKDFSERMQVSQSTVTQLADRLVKRGLVERYADPDDRRVVRLRVSEAGRAVVGVSDGRMRQVQSALWQQLTNENRTEIMATLRLLTEMAESIRAEMGHPLPPMPLHPELNTEQNATSSDSTQPVVDLMTRRVRGK